MIIKETIDKIQSLLSLDEVETAINLILALDDPKLNSEFLNGCSLNTNGEIVLNDFLSQFSDIKYYLFYTIFCLSQDEKLLEKSLIHKNIKKIHIEQYKANDFPSDIEILKNLEELIIDLDYTIQNNDDDNLLQLLPKFKKLKSISINTHGVGEASDRLFKSIYNLKNLESIIIKPAIMSIPIGMSNLKKISNIDINCTELFNISDEFLSLKLKTLHLRSHNPRIQRDFDKMFEYNYKRENKAKTSISYHKIDYYYGRS